MESTASISITISEITPRDTGEYPVVLASNYQYDLPIAQTANSRCILKVNMYQYVELSPVSLHMHTRCLRSPKKGAGVYGVDSRLDKMGRLNSIARPLYPYPCNQFPLQMIIARVIRTYTLPFRVTF